jgi:hypothetical protein
MDAGQADTRGGTNGEAACDLRGELGSSCGSGRGETRRRSSRRGFAVEIEDHGESTRGRGGVRASGCLDVPGFCEAAEAASDPKAVAPTRLVLTAPNKTMAAWLARWAEDDELVRRTITIRRVFDDAKITAVATLASYGSGIDTSLALESVALSSLHRAGSILRSGVHSKGAIDAALERMRKEPVR